VRLARVLSDSPPLTTRVFTSRLVLRPPRAADVPELRRLQRANLLHLRPWEPQSASTEDPASLTVIANRVTRQRRDWKRGDGYALLVAVRAPGEPIVGRVNLGGILRGAFQNAHVGYWIDQQHEGQGLMTEAVQAALSFAFGVARLHRVQMAIMPRNARSLRVVEKLGARREGVAARYLQIAGAWEDHVIFALTAEEWGAPSAEPAAR
jgi:ribosomal-protein-alanine N-acetyltransferase